MAWHGGRWRRGDGAVVVEYFLPNMAVFLTNSKTGRCWKLFSNLAPVVGANEDGAEHVQVGAKTDRQPK